MTLNDVLTKQNVITKVMLKDGDKELSKALDMTAPRLSEILNGRKDPTYRQSQKIAPTLKIDVNIVLAVS